MIRWMCDVILNVRKKSEEFIELLGMQSLIIKKSRLKWFEHVEHIDDNDCVFRCTMWEAE